MSLRQFHIRLAVVMAVLIPMGCSVSHHVRRVKQIDPSRDGVYYHLPETVLQIDVPIVKTSIKKGELASEVPNLDEKHRITITGKPRGEIKENVTYSFGEPVIATRCRPDRNEIFFIDVKGEGLVASEIVADLSEAGLIMTGDSKHEDKTMEYGAKIVEFAGSVGARVVGLRSAREERQPKSRAQEAAEAAKEIKSIRAERRALANSLIGSLPAETYDRKMKSLQEMEEDLMHLFREINITKWNAVFELPVDAKNHLDHDIDLVELSDTGPNIVLRKQLVNSMPDGFAEKHSNVRGGKCMKLRLEADGGLPKLATDNINDDNTNRVTSFVYRVPAQVSVYVFNGREIAKRTLLPVAQLGPKVALPAEPGGSTSTYNASFHPETGALKKVTVSSAPPDPGVLDSATNAAGTVLDAIKERQTAEAEENDELNILERKYNLLDYQLKIRDLERELANEINNSQ
jgi:hypothetical protein